MGPTPESELCHRTGVQAGDGFTPAAQDAVRVSALGTAPTSEIELQLTDEVRHEADDDDDHYKGRQGGTTAMAVLHQRVLEVMRCLRPARRR